MKKRIFSLLLALSMAFSLLPTAALAASDLDTAVDIVTENIEKIPLTNDTTEADLEQALTALLPAGNKIEITIEFVSHVNATTEKEGSIFCCWSLYDPTYHYTRPKETVILTIPVAGQNADEEAKVKEDLDAITAAFADYFATAKVDDSNILQQKKNLQEIMDDTVRYCTEAKFLGGSGFSTSLKEGYIRATFRLVLGGQTKDVELDVTINADGSTTLITPGGTGRPAFKPGAVYLDDPRCVNIGVDEAEWKYRHGEKFLLIVCTSGCGWCNQMKSGLPATLNAGNYSIFAILDDDSRLAFPWAFTSLNSLGTPYAVLVNGKDDVEVISSVRSQEAMTAVLEKAKQKGIPSADGTIVPAAPTTPAAPAAPVSDANDQSGSKSLPKLSQTEIAALIKAAPNTLSEYPFEVEPSVKAPYATGKVKDSALQAAVDRLTMLRRLAGLPAVELDLSLSEQAQYGAVLLWASEFSHTPAQPADMNKDFYEKGYAATSSSNIHVSYSSGWSITNSSYVLAKSPDGFMDDSDSSNVDRVGHRRWQLNPTLQKIGFGFAIGEKNNWFQQFVTEKVFDRSGSTSDYDFIAWPASGNFPNDLGAFDRDTAWSVTVNPARYATPVKNALTVTMTRASDGKTWTFSGSEYYFAGDSGMYFNVNTQGMGVNNCIIFRPDEITKYEGVYTVEIKGLTDSAGQPATIRYTVNFFDSSNPQDPAPVTPTTPTEPEKPVEPEKPTQPEEPVQITFTDVPDYFMEAVSWAVDKKITNGYDAATFGSADNCNQAQILTFLWRAKGEPEPAIANPFAGLDAAQFYAKPAIWAYEQGLISGSRFDAAGVCTRGNVVTYLWKLAGSPKSGAASEFTDVPAELADAVAWAAAQDITQGIGNGLFGTNDACTRGQIVTFLYRAYK